MDISGSYTLKAPRERVWECLLDPDMLQRTIPGCEKLEQTGPDEWRMRVNIGIAAVKGVYEGTLRMTDRVPPEQYRMVADGTGARSVLHGEGTLALEAPDPNTTVVNYQGQAQINGPLAGIANRVAPSVSKMLLKQFFGRFQQEMDATGASAPVADGTPSDAGTGARNEASDSAVADAPEAAGDASAGAAPSATPSAAPEATTTGAHEPDILDASTSGVWEMSLPEARPLDDGQVLASALPLDSVSASTEAPTASAAPTATAEPPAPAATPVPGAAPNGAIAVSQVSAAPPAGEPSVEEMSADDAPSTVATATAPASADDAIFDASTSGVWEMSLPEARPLDDAQTLATALPPDAAPATPAATASTAAPPAPMATASAATAHGTSAASSGPSAAPVAPASSAVAEPAAPAHTAAAAPAPVQPVAATTASASTTMPTGPRASSGSFMKWLMRLFGRAG